MGRLPEIIGPARCDCCLRGAQLSHGPSSPKPCRPNWSAGLQRYSTCHGYLSCGGGENGASKEVKPAWSLRGAGTSVAQRTQEPACVVLALMVVAARCHLAFRRSARSLLRGSHGTCGPASARRFVGTASTLIARPCSGAPARTKRGLRTTRPRCAGRSAASGPPVGPGGRCSGRRDRAHGGSAP